MNSVLYIVILAAMVVLQIALPFLGLDRFSLVLMVVFIVFAIGAF